MAGAALAAALAFGLAASADAAVTLSGNVTYYSGFSENPGVGITFSSTSPYVTDGVTYTAPTQFTDSFTSISDTADYGGTNSDPNWPGGLVLFGADFVGTIVAPATATYSFSFGADDAAYVFVNGGASPVASIQGGNDFFDTGAPRTISLALNAGSNSFEIQYANEFFTQAAIQFQAVPEPATWAMMLVGFGGLGAAMRSNRRKHAVAA